MLPPFHALSTLEGGNSAELDAMETHGSNPQRDALSAGAGEFPKALGIGM